ncbi:hypothetical protein FOZ61_001299 [Perkinsus olseni]|uniref:Uncharacterized protein n=1 Tax=Perkinsus olseni TaxID=32597 RepID=A0A7J6LPG8_PEROL|nr:hypothetical protein FOL46_005885 [Perkinsus olseni]KAF4663887.1 hypothetical protein FOZ61_001299 [Perkinsus olseni]
MAALLNKDEVLPAYRESGLLWISWPFLMGGRPTLSSLYAAGREGFILGLDAFQRSSALLLRQPGDFQQRRVMCRYAPDGLNLSTWTNVFEADRPLGSFRTLGDRSHVLVTCDNMLLVISSRNRKFKALITAPPGNDLSYLNCVSNGRFFMVGREDRKLFSATLPPFGKLPRPRSARLHPIEGVQWKAVADLPSDVTGMDVVAREDGKFKLVCVGYDVDTEENCIHYVDYEEIITTMNISEEALLCKFVPSNDEIVYVAGRADSSNFLWIRVVDIWSMSVPEVCRLEISGFGPKFSYLRFFTIMENGLVVLGLQNDVEEDPFFGVVVSQLECD